MSKLNKSQRKKAYVYVRDRIMMGDNVVPHNGRWGVCEMLEIWLVHEDEDLYYTDNCLSNFPEFLEEEPVQKPSNGPFWWPEHNDQLRIDALNRCIDKLKPIKK